MHIKDLFHQLLWVLFCQFFFCDIFLDHFMGNTVQSLSQMTFC
uniref:Uncharacterized protein n=1 Tax=Rhizophora mucronata TaxID=61149 RepID=A0A2P2PLN1_RHIMU